ncbi:type II toxin-antitoxin system VapC family toxin [Amaricoccus solimangrovi]|uniref:Type II toxin-antitoxin system VapC family toxin n=1 Tax=Amaricoccus solimangrovi TaxID=2589815 RepID=A0A501WD73_9RHOB|nr:type II toxin-antitoxin system VapC family toxin [Amaricoccus solimangrovi]TPE46782.1 type II toxin-antitoxin system VapC family toxin [Amaricoccus solimangrovi]
MLLDGSAIVAILNREPGSDELVRRIEAGTNVRTPLFSPLSRFEAIVSLARSRPEMPRSASAELIAAAAEAVDQLLTEAGAKSIAISDDIGTGASNAARTYGRAVRPPADLNPGDCFADACARTRGVALFYNGDDFARTDLA